MFYCIFIFSLGPIVYVGPYLVYKFIINMKKRLQRRKHCTLAVVIAKQFHPAAAADPFHRCRTAKM